MSEIDAIAILRRFNPTEREYAALTYEKWKDGIEVDYPTLTLERIASHIALLEKTCEAGESISAHKETATSGEWERFDEALRAAGYGEGV